jgi:hypothetical protein
LIKKELPCSSAFTALFSAQTKAGAVIKLSWSCHSSVLASIKRTNIAKLRQSGSRAHKNMKKIKLTAINVLTSARLGSLCVSGSASVTLWWRRKTKTEWHTAKQTLFGHKQAALVPLSFALYFASI